tara:strand:- start:1 stop:261 length:261 start_codon:yes stop_codon:yes gene_type:complete
LERQRKTVGLIHWLNHTLGYGYDLGHIYAASISHVLPTTVFGWREERYSGHEELTLPYSPACLGSEKQAAYNQPSPNEIRHAQRLP